jgi:hypothetical protein
MPYRGDGERNETLLSGIIATARGRSTVIITRVREPRYASTRIIDTD